MIAQGRLGLGWYPNIGVHFVDVALSLQILASLLQRQADTQIAVAQGILQG